jgi:hypothetical protein
MDYLAAANWWLLIGLGYHYYGKEAVKGNLLLEEYETHKRRFLKKWLLSAYRYDNHPFIWWSAGREGTAVQMGGAIADQFTKVFKLDNSERKTLIILGISAGFASVFGTP